MNPGIWNSKDITPTMTNNASSAHTVFGMDGQVHKAMVPVGSEVELEQLKQTAQQRIRAVARRWRRLRKSDEKQT